MSIRFNDESPVGKKLLWWWTQLPDHLGDRSTLRRANSITSVTLTPAYQRLCRSLGAAEWSASERDRLAAIVGLLSHVKSNDGRRPAAA